jgi:NAD(P)H dehydrogenase (quinone)
VYELTGPRSEDIDEIAADYSRALGKRVEYHDVPHADWIARSCRRPAQSVETLIAANAQQFR